MEITLVQLRMLREFDRCGTIVAAADRLGYTPSAISQQLAGMERAVGAPILAKAGRNVFLTDVGKTLVEHAEIILSQIERARVDVENLRCEVAGTLKLGMSTSMSSLLLAPLIDRLARTHPNLSVRTLDTSFAVSQELVRSGDLDICFTADTEFSDDPGATGLVRTLVCYDWFRLVVPAGALGDPPPSSVLAAELNKHSLIGPVDHNICGQRVARIRNNHGYKMDVAHESCDYPTVLRMVGGGLGVSFVPDLGLLDVPDNVDVLDLPIPQSRRIELLCREANTDRPAVRALVQAVVEVADELGLDRVGA